MSTLDRLFDEARDLEAYARLYAQYVSQLLASLDCAAVQRVGERLEVARKANATVFILGNGGSASTASHLANDLGFGPRRIGGAAYRAISLADNTSLLTAAANDIHYDAVFVEQLKTLLNPGDLVLAISASGNSPSVVKAARYARAQQAVVVAFTGFSGGELRDIAHEVIHVATAHGDYGPVEDVHMFLDHLLTSYLARLTARHSAAAGVPVSATRNHGRRVGAEPDKVDSAWVSPPAACEATVTLAPADRSEDADDTAYDGGVALPVAR